ncbi:uncharacterized protein LOC143631134 [Bidens hawaiensis]|uniref:uncharacterized protein LOC143631134 n=1 Tax=Bidens hawaiensis TaxID=980011 RepID=UPI0040492813
MLSADPLFFFVVAIFPSCFHVDTNGVGVRDDVTYNAIKEKLQIDCVRNRFRCTRFSSNDLSFITLLRSRYKDRAILAPTNEIVDEINESLLKFFPRDEVEYLSSYTICSSEYINDMVDAALYSPELLNGLRISGLPNHKLVLKVGFPVMLFRNLY